MLDSNANVIERIVGDSVSVEWSLDPDAGTMLVDAGQFEQMILNLAINARDAMASGGTLRISIESIEVGVGRAEELNVEPGPFVTVHVTDTGLGMDDVTLTSVSIRSSPRRDLSRDGNGLAAARRLVEEAAARLLLRVQSRRYGL